MSQENQLLQIVLRSLEEAKHRQIKIDSDQQIIRAMIMNQDAKISKILDQQDQLEKGLLEFFKQLKKGLLGVKDK